MICNKCGKDKPKKEFKLKKLYKNGYNDGASSYSESYADRCKDCEKNHLITPKPMSKEGKMNQSQSQKIAIKVEKWIDSQYGTAGWEIKLHNFIQTIAGESYAEGYAEAIKKQLIYNQKQHE